MDDKTGAEKLQGYWVIEIGELAGMKKADVEKVKGFLSTTDDKYRPSYGRVVESHPRQCVVIVERPQTGRFQPKSNNADFVSKSALLGGKKRFF